MTDRQTDRQTHIWIIKNSPVSKNVRREEKDGCEKQIDSTDRAVSKNVREGEKDGCEKQIETLGFLDGMENFLQGGFLT